jgi:hypothetical protein
MLNMGAAGAHQAAGYDDEAARLQERARALERLAREFAVEETP